MKTNLTLEFINVWLHLRVPGAVEYNVRAIEINCYQAKVSNVRTDAYANVSKIARIWRVYTPKCQY